MSHLARCCLLALACGAGVASAGEAKVYRCGQSYQQAPCAPGTAGQAIDADDSRSAEQRSDARAAAAADKRQARTLVAERRQREKEIRPQQAPVIIGQRPPEPAAGASAPGAGKPPSKKRKKKSAEPDRYLPWPPAGQR